MTLNAFPLFIEFAPGSHVEREPDFVSKLPIVGNGPPATRVVFQDGVKVHLPTDQIVFSEDAGGAARVGFGGMSAAGLEDGQLTFYRFHDLKSAALLSPERAQRMTLDPRMVTSVSVDGRVVWPRQ